MRCKSCDSILKEDEIVFRNEKNSFEELCRRCLKSVYSDNEDLIPDQSELELFNGEDEKDYETLDEDKVDEIF